MSYKIYKHYIHINEYYVSYISSLLLRMSYHEHVKSDIYWKNKIYLDELIT